MQVYMVDGGVVDDGRQVKYLSMKKSPPASLRDTDRMTPPVAETLLRTCEEHAIREPRLPKGRRQFSEHVQ